MSMFKGKEVVTMPKDITVPRPEARTGIAFMPEVRETDYDAEDNLIAAHRRMKAELAESKRLKNDAIVEIRTLKKIIEQLEASLVDYEQCKKDCAALENLFQNIASLTDSFLKPREIPRERETVEQSMVKKVKEIIEDKHDGHGD